MSLVLRDQLELGSGGGGDVSNKVDKITDPSKVYATDSQGGQTGITYSTSADANTVAERDANAQVNVNLTPTTNNNATSKKYVDDRVNAAIAEAVVFKGIVADQTALPQSGNTNGDMYWITAFVSPAPTGMTVGRSGSAIYKGDPDNRFEYTEDAIYQPDEQTIDLNGNGKLAVQISATANNSLSSQNDGLYIDISGKVDKTSTENQVYGTDASGNQTTIKYSIPAQASSIVKRTTQGQITVVETPSANTDATSKKYVDDADANKVDKTNTAYRLYGTSSNGSQTTLTYDSVANANTIAIRDGNGQVYVAQTPTADGQATSKKYVDTADSGKVDKTSTANQVYATNHIGDQVTINLTSDVSAWAIPRRGVGGLIKVPLTPTDNDEATSKKYVDDALAAKQNKPTITTISTDTYSVTPADNTIYNATSTLTSLSITVPSSMTVDYTSEINFTSGSTATVVTSSDITWVGDNVNEDTGFQPRTNCRYNIMFTYDGVNFYGLVRGVSVQ